MTLYVQKSLNDDSMVSGKSGRPLLFYAVYHITPQYIFVPPNRDRINPQIVQTLLEYRADPNEEFLHRYPHSGRDSLDKTPWEGALLTMKRRFTINREGTFGYGEFNNNLTYYASLQPEKIEELKNKWLDVVELFLKYGANVNATIETKNTKFSETDILYTSPLSVFNRAVSHFDDERVKSIRTIFLEKGAKEKDEYVRLDRGHEGRLNPYTNNPTRRYVYPRD